MKEYTLKELKKIKWGVLEENIPISLYPVMYPGWCQIIKNLEKILGKRQKSIICLHEGKKGIIFVDHKEWNNLGIYVLNKIILNPGFAVKLNKEILKYSDKLVDYVTKNIFNADLPKKKNSELYEMYKNYEEKHGDLYARAIIPVYLELYKPNLTKYLTAYLEKKIKRTDYQRTAKECFAILTSVSKSSKVQLEEISLLNLSIIISNNNVVKNIFLQNRIKDILEKTKAADKKIYGKIANHMEKYRYLGYNFEGPPFPDSYFIERWREIFKRKEDAGKILKKIRDEKKLSERLILKIEKNLKLDKKHLRLFEIAREIIFGKDYRKMSLVESYYRIEPLLEEISKRLKLNIGQVRNLLLDEAGAALSGEIVNKSELSKRMKGCLFAVINGRLPGRVYTNEIFFRMKEYLKKKEDLSEIMYFHGQTASIGKATGTVKIINAIKDLPKMREGDILVSQMTNPDLVPAMKIAGAIVTDLGGITCHAAIVSRELKKPCVIGTKIATRALKDGDAVFVDANQGEVKILTKK